MPTNLGVRQRKAQIRPTREFCWLIMVDNYLVLFCTNCNDMRMKAKVANM